MFQGPWTGPVAGDIEGGLQLELQLATLDLNFRYISCITPLAGVKRVRVELWHLQPQKSRFWELSEVQVLVVCNSSSSLLESPSVPVVRVV